MSTMENNEVESSNISRMSHDSETEVLEIMFANGGKYTYEGVPKNTAIQLFEADSTGKAFYSLIRGKFEAKKVVEEE